MRAFPEATAKGDRLPLAMRRGRRAAFCGRLEGEQGARRMRGGAGRLGRTREKGGNGNLCVRVCLRRLFV